MKHFSWEELELIFDLPAEYGCSILRKGKEDPPGCEGCSVGEFQTVISDKTKARNMMKCAIDKLNQYRFWTGPVEVKVALLENFGGYDSELLAKYLEFLFRYIHLLSVATEYTAQNVGEGLCGENTYGWSYPAVHGTNVRLCRPKYWESPEDERVETLIHEWMHLFYVTGDIAYDWDPTYQEMSTLAHLFNADSFTQFIEDVCP